MPQLEVVEIPTSELMEYPNNAKLHPHEQVDQIASSIEEFGFNNPILAWHNDDGEPEIVAGHGRLMAAKKLGLDMLPVVFLDHMSDEQRRAYILVDNKLTMNSDFDYEVLNIELQNIFDIDMGQFDFDIDIDDGFADDVKTSVVEDDVPDQAPSIVHKGDVWQLGRHRLMCGDSTNADNVAVLMGDDRADVCFTSPPYNLNGNMSGGWDSAPNKALRGGVAYNEFSDNLTDGDYTDLLCDSLANALSHCDDAMFNIGILSNSKHGIANMMHRFADQLGDILVWNKSTSLPHGMESQHGMVSHRCELIFCFNHDGKRSFSHPQWSKGTMINRIDTENASGNEYAKKHAATFPVSFAAEIISKFTESSVLDLFGGTGTTLIAAEQYGRTCYMMEIDPTYCDIIIERWQRFTGESAVKVSG